MDFPIFKTKVEGLDKKFDLISPEGQKEYFEAKAGADIEKIRNYLKSNTFIAYLLGKKNSGKGTYSKMLAKIIGPDLMAHFSIGDMVREIDKELADPAKKSELVKYLEKNYRGRSSLEEIMASLEGRSTQKLLPTELILVLVKREIDRIGKKTLFIDGFPRDMDQIDFSLFFRDLIGFRDDPDIFVLIDLPETIIDERIKWRLICPKCKTSRNLKLLPTSKVGFNKETNKYYLMCDNPECNGAVMETKEGDELGIANIKVRLETDDKLIKEAMDIHGIPVDKAKEYIDDYEITPEYVFKNDNGKIETEEKPWIVKDDNGVDSFSLMPPPVVISFIKQMVKVFNI